MPAKTSMLQVTVIIFSLVMVIAGLSDRFFLEFQNTGTVVSYYLMMAVTALVLSLLLKEFIKRRFLQPLRQVLEGIEYIISRQEPGAVINTNNLYEMSELGLALNRMLEGMKNKHNELKESENKYKHLSFYDSLTGLHNRSYFEYEMKRISGNPWEVQPLSIISVDIDGHKIVNDTFGHQAGDKQLKYVAELLQTTIRKEDTLARVGGDEFCILLPNMPNPVAQQRKQEIVEAVERHNNKNPFIPLSISVGVATGDFTEGGATVYDVYHQADDDMYYQKFNKEVHTKGRAIEYFLTALSERDNLAPGHADRMAHYAQKMAVLLELTAKEQDDLVLLAKLHDLGNIGIPDEILFKSGILTEEETKRLQTHVNIGYNIACRSAEVAHIAEYILHHHEWWDGMGYPSGLQGEEIPLPCRIIAILDAFDAMTTSRIYRAFKSPREALEELVRCSGHQFDAELVLAFLEIYDGECLQYTGAECIFNA
jgi:diguanylate cyclase (GGDEF)-like protein